MRIYQQIRTLQRGIWTRHSLPLTSYLVN